MFSRIRPVILLLAVAFAMTLLFWWPLYQGAGFIGGDLYPYFFPQKTFYAENIKQGLFPLWNDQAGFGYPVLGESQTGAAYPLHFILYFTFDLNTAYNIEHLLHYVICFCATYLFARRLGLMVPGAYLTAIVFTYGWFPARSCLEWAILTGAWMPVALYCVESFLQTGHWRYAIGLSVAIGLQLLAGHYHLAFITQLLVTSYAVWKIWNAPPTKRNDVRPPDNSPRRASAAIGLMAALIAGVALASVQVLPTWELKQRSSRVATSSDYDPAYGHLPPQYLSQMIAPWNWYSLQMVDEDNWVRDFAELVAPWHWFGPQHDRENVSQHYDLDRAINRCRFATPSAGTNKVEAHCYTGILPILFAFLMTIHWSKRNLSRSKSSQITATTPPPPPLQVTFWLIAAIVAIIYATGFLLPIGRHLPGFSFFRGPGRYGIVTTLAIALLAGEQLNLFLKASTGRALRGLLVAVVLLSTCGDLWLVSRMVKYTVMVSPPRITFRDQSIVRKMLMAESSPPRLLAPGPNVCSLLGVSCVPWYLGIAPSEYVDPQYAMPAIPKPLATNKPTPGDAELNDWLSHSGVTHVLSFDLLDEPSWQVELVWNGHDPFLNRVWGRSEPIYLYRFRHRTNDENKPPFPGRAYTQEGDGRFHWADPKQSRPGSRRLTLELDQNEKTTLVLTELAYPGWIVRKGTELLEPRKVGMFRAADVSRGTNEIEWTYQPSSVFVGTIVSLFTLFILAAIAHLRYWHCELTDHLTRRLLPWLQ